MRLRKEAEQFHFQASQAAIFGSIFLLNKILFVFLSEKSPNTVFQACYFGGFRHTLVSFGGLSRVGGLSRGFRGRSASYYQNYE